MFRNNKFQCFKHLYNLFEYFQNKGIDSNSILLKCQNRNGSIKDQQFLSRGSNKLYSSHREKKKVPLCEMFEFSGSLSSPMLSILPQKLKIIAYRGSSTIPPSYKLELICQYEITSIDTNSSITDDLGVRDQPLFFFCFLCKTLPKRLILNEVHIYMFKLKKKGTRTRCDIYLK